MKNTRVIDFAPPNPQAIRLNDNSVQEVYRIICEQINYNTKLIELIKEANSVNYIEILVLFMLPNFDLDLLKDEYKNRADFDGIFESDKLIGAIKNDLDDYIKIKNLLIQCEEENAGSSIDIECVYMHLFCMKSRVVSHLRHRSSEVAVEKVLQKITSLSSKEIKEYVSLIETENSAATSDIKPLTECLSLLQGLISEDYSEFMNRCTKFEDIGMHMNQDGKRLHSLALKLIEQSHQAFIINRDVKAAENRMQLIKGAQWLIDLGPIANIVQKSTRNPQQEVCDGIEGKSSPFIMIGDWQIGMKNYEQIHKVVQDFILPLESMISEVKAVNNNLSTIVQGHNAASFVPQEVSKKSGKNKKAANRVKQRKQKKEQVHAAAVSLKIPAETAEKKVNDNVKSAEQHVAKITVAANTPEPAPSAAEPRSAQALETQAATSHHDDNSKQFEEPRTFFAKMAKKQFFKRIIQEKPQPKIPDNVVIALTKHRESFEKMFTKPTPHLAMTFDELRQLVVSVGGDVKPNGGSYYRIVLFGTYTQVLARNPLIAMKQKLKKLASNNSEEQGKVSFGKTSLVIHAPHGKSHNSGMVKSYVVTQFMEAFVRVGLIPEKLWSDNAVTAETHQISTQNKM